MTETRTAKVCDTARDGDVSLRELTHVLVDGVRSETKLLVEGLEARVLLKFIEDDKGRAIASEALTLRMDHANGLIKQMKDRESEVARIESLDALKERVESLERHRSSIEGKGQGSQPIRDIAMLVLAAGIAYVASRLSTP